MIEAQRSDRPVPPADVPHRVRPRWLVPVLLAAVGLALVLSWLNFSGGGGEVAIDDVPVLRADTQPVKVRPTDPGGLKVSDRDKLIYRRFGREGEGPAVERLLPPPEQPAPLPQPTQSASPPDVPEAADPPPEADTSDATPVAPPAAADAGVEPAPRSAPPEPAPAPAPVPPKSVAAGNFQVQVAAVRSETQARAAWSDLQRKYPDLLGTLSLTVVRADLGAKGVFYRIRGGPIAENDAARALCDKLKARGTGCMVVRHGD